MNIPNDFRFDEIKNVRCAIDLCVESVQRIEEEDTYLKWLIIATHDMLQGAMVCALSGSDGTGALEKASRKARLRLNNIRVLLGCVENTYSPDPNLTKAQTLLLKEGERSSRLAEFKKLLKSTGKPERSGYGKVEPLE